MAGWVFAVLGGLIGLIVGWNFYALTTTLPNGRRVPTYSPDDRRQSLWMMVVATIMLVLGIAFRLIGYQ